MNLTRGIDLRRIAEKMTNASGAEVKACCTESGMFALRERRVHVTQVRVCACVCVRVCVCVCVCVCVLRCTVHGAGRGTWDLI